MRQLNIPEVPSVKNGSIAVTGDAGAVDAFETDALGCASTTQSESTVTLWIEMKRTFE